MQKDKQGRYICPACNKPMNSVIQTMYDDITWTWDIKTKQYVKSQGGDAEDPKCGECYAKIDQQYADELGY
ncbi:MAG: hypothetical protein LHV68_05130 [Elusimicrobia bacterium]|nr:hypothetical protein [Candidatus Liberimonas magnetica]